MDLHNWPDTITLSTVAFIAPNMAQIHSSKKPRRGSNGHRYEVWQLTQGRWGLLNQDLISLLSLVHWHAVNKMNPDAERMFAATPPCWSPRWCGSVCLWAERWSCCWGRPPPPSACWSSATAAVSVDEREEISWERVREETVMECVAKREFGDGEKERVAKIKKYFRGMEKVRA